MTRHILVTGANGYVGRALSLKLKEQGHRLTLLDQSFQGAPGFGDAHLVQGSFSEPATLDEALHAPVDIAYHLASVPGSLAERYYELGYQVNLHGTLALAHRLANQGMEAGHRTRLVFASSVAVYGDLAGSAISENHLPVPCISYGAHKLMIEIALADLSRRKLLDAISLRLPGIVARPPTESGHGSAFMSLIMHKMAAGQPYQCPVGPEATAWWMSLPCCIANLMHAGGMDSALFPPDRTWQLPVLHLSIQQVLDALEQRFGETARGQISHAPDPVIEALFGRYPAMHTPQAEAAGFMHDKNAVRLVAAALGNEANDDNT